MASAITKGFENSWNFTNCVRAIDVGDETFLFQSYLLNCMLV